MKLPAILQQNKWIKKGGIFLFLFFLIKGLIWLAIFFGAAAWIFS